MREKQVEVIRKTGIFGGLCFLLAFVPPPVQGFSLIFAIVALCKKESRILPATGIIIVLFLWALRTYVAVGSALG